MRDVIKNLVEIQLDRIGREHLALVEIGSFDGECIIQLAEKYKKAKIYAIEPCPDNFKVLFRKVQKYKNIFPCKVAISSKSGPVDFYIARNPKFKDGSSPESNSIHKCFVRDKKWVNTQFELNLN